MSGNSSSSDSPLNPFGSRAKLPLASGSSTIIALASIAEAAKVDFARLPMTVKIVLENLLRHANGKVATEDDVLAWLAGTRHRPTLLIRTGRRGFFSRTLTGVPAVVDLAAMRSAAARLGGDPTKINPLIPADLVIDHSVQVDRFGSSLAFCLQRRSRNTPVTASATRCFRWAQQAFDNFLLVPPRTGIVHQVNLEFLARVVQRRPDGHGLVAYPTPALAPTLTPP